MSKCANVIVIYEELLVLYDFATALYQFLINEEIFLSF
jgi:hypothetical protein